MSGVLVVVSGAALFAASGAVLVCGCAGLPRLPPKEASSGGVNPLGAVPCALPGIVNPVGIVNSPAPPKFMPSPLPLFMLPMSDVVMSLASTNASLFCCPCEVDVLSGRYVIDAKSIMGLFSLDLSHPVKVEVHGSDADRSAFEQSVAAFEVKQTQ